MGKLFLSHRIDFLARSLTSQLDFETVGPLTPRFILVPNASLKQWLLLELAKNSPGQAIAGVSVLTLQEGLRRFCRPSGYVEIFCFLFHALPLLQNRDLQNYLNEAEGTLIELSSWLTETFMRYSHFFPPFFEEEQNPGHWQKELIQNLFVKGPLRHPLKKPASPPPIHCFGFDFLPDWIWKMFQFPSVYLFSPCSQFWEDLCSERERKRYDRFWKQRGAREEQRQELDAYLSAAPPLLANWGGAGRETLKILDSFSFEIFEHYEREEETPSTTLTRLQQRLLDFDLAPITMHPADDSIRIVKTGSSLLQEVQQVYNAIIQLIDSKNIPCAEMAVLAPDIQPYAPFIKLLFSNIPFRISALDIGQKSFFFQGMHRLFEFNCNVQQEFIELFENRAFAAMRGWNSESLAWIRERFAEKLWKEEDLLDKFLYIRPEEPLRLATSSADLLEEWIALMREIRSDIASLQTARPLSEWASFLPSLVKKYFFIDQEDETEEAAWNFFEQTLNELSHVALEEPFPFEPIKALLKRPIPGGQINASHLHALRFASLAEGSATPVRALFLLGMSEENFPRKNRQSSLDLLRCENVYTFESSERDRYLLLQTLFAAKEFLYISYGHLSSEGTPIHPSPLIEELKRSVDAPLEEEGAAPPEKGGSLALQFSFPWRLPPCIPHEELTLSLSDLAALARHPWGFYLKKRYGIQVPHDAKESLSSQQRKILRASPHQSITPLLRQLPSGLCGEFLSAEIQENATLWASRMHEWGLSSERLFLKASCREKRKVPGGWEMPPLEIPWNGNTTIKIIGDLQGFSEKGFVYRGKDSIASLLPQWPEALASLIAAQTHEIFILDTAKIKTIEAPREAMRHFLSYFFFAQEAVSPLIPSWADSILRKGGTSLHTKIEKMERGRERFEDPIFTWVAERTDLPPAEEWVLSWKEPLIHAFEALGSLYPVRGQANETL